MNIIEFIKLKQRFCAGACVALTGALLGLIFCSTNDLLHLKMSAALMFIGIIFMSEIWSERVLYILFLIASVRSIFIV